MTGREEGDETHKKLMDSLNLDTLASFASSDETPSPLPSDLSPCFPREEEERPRRASLERSPPRGFPFAQRPRSQSQINIPAGESDLAETEIAVTVNLRDVAGVERWIRGKSDVPLEKARQMQVAIMEKIGQISRQQGTQVVIPENGQVLVGKGREFHPRHMWCLRPRRKRPRPRGKCRSRSAAVT